MGQSISIALAGAIFTSLGGAVAGATLRSLPPTAPLHVVIAQENTFSSAFHTTFIFCAVIAAVGIFTSLVRGKGKVEVAWTVASE